MILNLMPAKPVTSIHTGHIPDLDALIQEFKDRRDARHCSTPRGAAMNCGIMSGRFTHFLWRRGMIHAEVWCVTGFNDTPTMLPVWKRIHPTMRTHYIARVGDTYVDWTRRQFDAETPYPAMYKSLDEAAPDRNPKLDRLCDMRNFKKLRLVRHRTKKRKLCEIQHG